jgi:hypothetical protein
MDQFTFDPTALVDSSDAVRHRRGLRTWALLGAYSSSEIYETLTLKTK